MSPRAVQSESIDGGTLEPIAICGMACRLPGGVNSESSFWKMLVEKRTGQTPKVPASRFNIDAHLHENLDRPGSLNVPGGYFLDGSLEDFDATFFNITPVEAQCLDPQQRKMLEVSYECMMSAGLTLEEAAGSNTAVFVGSFTSDYQQMSTREPDFRPNYAATGVDTGIISNRVGNIFNLNGPSFTINTACSSSVYAMHNACHALRARDCDAAIVGGVNLIITVDQQMNTAKLGVLSPTSTCHTFDASADGYGRAEAAGAMYLKRLSDAIRCGDPIRGVLRATAVNTNGRVPGLGITHPSVKGQERVIRMAYEKARLDPNLTAYAELHGTGTPVGDPVEVKAISNALNDTRSREKPLVLGAVKPNIGHSEAASGIFAVMKAALMTESGVIPGTALLENLNPAIHEDEWNVEVNRDTSPWPSGFPVRRASVSSFGYGGTNGHVVVEAVESLYPSYQHAKSKREAPCDHSTSKAVLVCLSAHDKPTLNRVISDTAAVASDYYTIDLAHTLNVHRTAFAQRAFTIMRNGQETAAFDATALRTGGAPSKKSEGAAFLFTGQGAQWAGMGRVAMVEFPIFADVIHSLDRILAQMKPTPTFKLADVLLADPVDAAASLAEPLVVQPLCTAVQIALVELFSQWEVEPVVSVGHSSGEIAAAYAAGLISAPEAIVAAYCRGVAVQSHSTTGSMLAVGLGAKEVKPHLPLDLSDACIACENSPQSVTVSGRVEVIAQLGESLHAQGIFVRELKTGRAYHSPHMDDAALAYKSLLSSSVALLTREDRRWRRARSEMVSSVTGERVTGNVLTEDYFCLNLTRRVRFDEAVQHMAADEAFGGVTVALEVGPHSALASPFKQIRQAAKLDRLTYIASMVRNKNDADQLLSVAGSLFLTNYPVRLEEVNAAAYDERDKSAFRKPRTQYLLVDLPPYPWNYERSHWYEPRGSAEQRGRAYPRHDLLGSRVSGLSSGNRVWRNILSVRDVPWLADHRLGGSAIFPAAGYLAMAIEAARQVYETEEGGKETTLGGITLRDVDLKIALSIPNAGDEGVETLLSLLPSDTPGWYSFTIESCSEEGKWISHCVGRIRAETSAGSMNQARCPVVEKALDQYVPARRWYDAFKRVGFHYGPAFQQMKYALTNGSLHAAGDVVVQETSGLIQGESRAVIHPSTIDACLHLVIISIHAGKHREMSWGVVPTRIEEVSMAFPGAGDVDVGHALAWSGLLDDRRFKSDLQLQGKSGQTLLDIKNIACVSYEAAVPVLAGDVAPPAPFSVSTWKPDLSKIATGKTVESVLRRDKTHTLSELVGLVAHRQSVSSVFIFGSPTADVVDAVIHQVPSAVAVKVGYTGDNAPIPSEKATGMVTLEPVSSEIEAWDPGLKKQSFDVVVVGKCNSEEVLPLTNDEGWVLGLVNDASVVPESALVVGDYYALQKKGREVTQDNHLSPITLLSFHDTESSRDLAAALQATGNSVAQKTLSEYNGNSDAYVVVDDTNGQFFSSLNAASFTALKQVFAASTPVLWLTKGVQEGHSMVGGMAAGFLRVLCSEMAAARVVLLDYSKDESLRVVGRAVFELLSQADTKVSGCDNEFWISNGVVHVSRLAPDDKINREIGGVTSVSDLPRGSVPVGEPMKVRVMDGEACLEPVGQHAKLAPNEVAIQLSMTEAPVPHMKTVLAAGTVFRAGEAVDSAVIGRYAVCVVSGELATVAHTAVFATFDNQNQATSGNSTKYLQTLGHLAKIVDLTLHKTQLQSGHVLLALPGPTATLEVLARLCSAHGWSLAIATRSKEELEHYELLTTFKDATLLAAHDVESLVRHLEAKAESAHEIAVLAHDFADLSREIWRRIPASGRFMLLNSESKLLVPDAGPFARGACFVASPASAAPSSLVLASCLREIEQHPEILSSDAILVNGDHAGTSAGHGDSKRQIISLRSSDEFKMLPAQNLCRLSGDAVYLLVGCLGGLGRSLTKHMMKLGARHFAFISRSATDKPQAAAVIEEIEKAGSSTHVFRTDASDEAAVRNVIAQVTAQRPLRGVVHAAMVLKDGMFEQLDHDSFEAVMAPKARGAVALHNALQDVPSLNLDFFVVTSSVSALLGNTGQSSYSAANGVLESLVRFRMVHGLPATCLALPMVLDVGVVAETEGLEASLTRKGLYGIDEEEMLRGFEVAMAQGRADTVFMGMDASRLSATISFASLAATDLYWYWDARFCHVRAAIEAASKQNASAGCRGAESFAETVKEALEKGDYDAAIQATALHIAKRVGFILMIPVEDIDLNGPSIASYGLDSMIGSDMRTWLFKNFGLDYPFQQLLASTLTFTKLATIVAKNIGIVADALA